MSQQKKGCHEAEPRKHTILPRNHDNFSEASYFFSEEFYTLWSFSPRIGGTYHFRSSFFHTFVFNLWKNQAEYSISVVKYQIFLLFIKIFLGTRFLGSSKNLDSGVKFQFSRLVFDLDPNAYRSGQVSYTTTLSKQPYHNLHI